MKKFLVVALALATGSVFAQNANYGTRYQNQEASSTGSGLDLAQPGQRHMVEFTPDTLHAAVLSFNRTKNSGTSADSDTDINFQTNYAYGIHRFLQVGFRFGYASGLSGAANTEELKLQVGGIVNFNQDFTQAAYASVWLGAGFIQDFSSPGTRDDMRYGTIAVGKRFPLTMFGVKHVVYSPEVALAMANSTTDEKLDYSQSLQFRALQFSVFF